MAVTKNLREQHQASLIEKYTMEGNTALSKGIRGMQQAEEVKQVYQCCQAARNLEQEGGLSYLPVPSSSEEDPKTCQDWKRVNCPVEMKKQLTAHNQKHFGQSIGCTLTSPPLDFTMAITATCQQAKAILNGTFL